MFYNTFKQLILDGELKAPAAEENDHDKLISDSSIPPLSLLADNDVTDTDKKNGPEEFGSMSPLLPPLEDFNFNVPEIPTFEDNSLPDHIIRENALFSLINEHDYARKTAPPVKQDKGLLPGPSHLKGVPRGSLKPKHGHGSPLKVKKLKVRKPLDKKKKKNKKKSRRRHSSSEGSSSCSSCNTDCSCSSSSSSSSSGSSSSSSDSSDSEQETVVAPKKRRGRPPLHNRPVKPIVVTDPSVKRGRGRPKGSTNKPKTGVPSTPSTRGGKRGPKPGSRRIHKPVPINNVGHGIPPSTTRVSDLETDDSGSEEAFHKRQLTETMGAHASNIDEIWTMGNEKYLLKYLRGVKDVEELRPPPDSIKVKKVKRVKKKRDMNGTPQTKGGDASVYSVKPSSGPPIRLKVKNVPVKPLTLIKKDSLYISESSDVCEYVSNN